MSNGPSSNPAIYDTNVLVQVVPNLLTSQQFLLDRFFPYTVMSDSEKVSIDVDVGKRRMSPFVSPYNEGRLVEQRRYQTDTFTPPYIKDKRAPDLMKPVRRMIGERIGGNMTGAQREMANLEAEMTDQVDMLKRRMEWMAGQVLMSGTVTIIGDGYPEALIDFGRDPTLTVVNAGNTTWTAANIAAGTASPTGDIEAMQTQILQMSGGTCTDIIFTPSSWAGFKLDPELKGAIVFPKLQEFPNAINVGPAIAKGAVFKGTWGQYALWLYNDWYVDDNNVQQPMLVNGQVIMSGPDLMGTRAFGQIKDPAFNYEAVPFAPKSWISEDPPQRFIMLQSAPVVIPSRVNASASLQVV